MAPSQNALSQIDEHFVLSAKSAMDPRAKYSFERARSQAIAELTDQINRIKKIDFDQYQAHKAAEIRREHGISN